MPDTVGKASFNWDVAESHPSPLGRENLLLCFGPAVGFRGQTAKLLCFLIFEFHQGTRAKMSMQCLRCDVEFLMKWDLFWRKAAACIHIKSQTVYLPWLHSSNNKFRCMRSEASCFIQIRWGDVSVSAAYRARKWKSLFAWIHCRSVIIFEKLYYNMLNSHRDAAWTLKKDSLHYTL